jgi:hypothetical protein
MPLLVFGLVWVLVAAIHWLSLRVSGGWLRLYESRRQADRGDTNSWSQLTTIQRAWFYGIPVSLALGLVCVLGGIVLTATGHG